MKISGEIKPSFLGWVKYHKFFFKFRQKLFLDSHVNRQMPLIQKSSQLSLCGFVTQFNKTKRTSVKTTNKTILQIFRRGTVEDNVL